MRKNRQKRCIGWFVRHTWSFLILNNALLRSKSWENISLLDARYQRAVRQEALTVIAANYQNTDELSGYLKSRIEDNRFVSNGYVIPLKGTDGRKSMPKNWKY